MTYTWRRWISWRHNRFGQHAFSPYSPYQDVALKRACIYYTHIKGACIIPIGKGSSSGKLIFPTVRHKIQYISLETLIVVEVFFLCNLKISERHIVTLLMHSDGDIHSRWLWIYKQRFWKRSRGSRWIALQWRLGQCMNSWTCWIYINLIVIVTATVREPTLHVFSLIIHWRVAHFEINFNKKESADDNAKPFVISWISK